MDGVTFTAMLCMPAGGAASSVNSSVTSSSTGSSATGSSSWRGMPRKEPTLSLIPPRNPLGFFGGGGVPLLPVPLVPVAVPVPLVPVAVPVAVLVPVPVPVPVPLVPVPVPGLPAVGDAGDPEGGGGGPLGFTYAVLFSCLHKFASTVGPIL